MSPEKPKKQTARKKPSRRRGSIRVVRKDSVPKVKKSKRSKPSPAHAVKRSGGPRKRSTTAKKTTRRKSTAHRRPRPPKHQKVTYVSARKKTKALPSPGENLRIIPLGGVEEIGKNMTAIEYKDDIVIVDVGFQFSEAETPGVDYIIPDVTYLEERKEKIRAVFITHGHYDHIGAVPYIMQRIGNPPIYSRAFGAAIIQKRQMEFPHVPELDMRIVDGDEKIKVGTHFNIEFFPITHAIPDSMGLLIGTPIGEVAFIEDIRVDHVGEVPTQREVEHWKRFKDRNILLMTLDSTGVEEPGFSQSEADVFETIDEIMKEVPGRLIIGTFASQVERVMEFISIAQKYNKKVIIDGRSMKSNVEIIKQLNLMKLENIIPIESLEDYPPDKIVMIATGAQGEQYSVFDRIGNNSHKYVKLNKTDTIIFSSSVIPGNEMDIQKLKDNLYRQEARIITYRDAKVHASGHGKRGDLEWIHKQINYKFFMPVHGHHFMLRMHAELSQSLGTPEANTIIPDNGSIVEITPEGKHIKMLKEKAPSDLVMVDGFSVSDKQEVVLRDRKTLAEEGMFVIVISIDPRTGKLRKSPDIIARGFVYLRESQNLLNETRAIIKRTAEKTTKGMHPINFDIVKDAVTDDVRKHLFQKTAKSPIVIPVVIGV